jgi:Hint domain-containing protein
MALSVVCFKKGTRIWTPKGEANVEDLQIGDLVVTASGEARPIQWTWRRRFDRDAIERHSDEVIPIRVAQSALGPNTPHRDLYVSRYHCLYLDESLIPANDLINGITISRCDAKRLQEIEYFHIKLDRHSIIYAEGAACETLQAVSAENCDESELKEYKLLHGEPVLPDEPAAPILGYCGGRARMKGRIRSFISPVLDVRSKLDIVRDELKERAKAMAQQHTP